MRLLLFIIGLFLCSPIYAKDFLETSETRVLTPKPKFEIGKTREQKEREIESTFKALYTLQQRPSIAILWNRKFSDVFSEWQADSRQTSESSMTGRPISQGEQNSKTDNEESKKDESADCSLYFRSVGEGDCHYTKRNYSERRVTEDKEKNDTQFSSQLEEFKFNSGYAQTFLNVGAKVIDRATIMRLVERKQQQERGTVTLPDYYRIEADALIGHADYLAELLLVEPDESTDWKTSFSVSIKDVATGQILAMLHTKGEGLEGDVNEIKEWQASDSGYTLKRREAAAAGSNQLSEAGRVVALETMQALNNIWSE